MPAPAHGDARIKIGARLQRYRSTRPATDPLVVATAQDLAEARIEAAVAKIVAAAPPLRPEQADRLAGIIARSAR